MSDQDLPFLTDVEVSIACFDYYNQDSINAPSGEISFVLLPGNQLSGTMTMNILWGLPKKGTLTIKSGTVSSDKLNYTFVAEGYLKQFDGPTTHIGPLNLELVLQSGGQEGVLNGLMTGTVAKAVPCKS